MKVKIEDIDKDGLCFDIVEDFEKINTALLDSRLVHYVSPVTASLHIRNLEGEIYVNGTIDVDVVLKCVRCLAELNSHIHSVLNLIFLRAPEEKEAEKELSEEELNICYYSDNELNVYEIISEEIILNLPVKPLCKTDCSGLCPKCGVDLNKDKCSCSKEKGVDARLKKLMEFKRKA